MKNTIFTGMATAIVTPMTKTDIDYDALGRFLDFQIDSGINAIVVMGTTGENATIEPEDQDKVIRFTVEKVAHRVPVIAGTGTNNTAHVLHNTRNACAAGADAILVVTPYYNKATQNGLITHFTAVADESTVPVILYNVPGRTGCNLLPKTVAKLAEHPRIAAINEGCPPSVISITQRGGLIIILISRSSVTLMSPPSRSIRTNSGRMLRISSNASAASFVTRL